MHGLIGMDRSDRTTALRIISYVSTSCTIESEQDIPVIWPAVSYALPIAAVVAYLIFF